MTSKSPDALGREKALVASRAAAWIAPGMRIGIGSGATVALFVEALGRRHAREGLDVQCVAASEATARLASAAGLDVRGFDVGLPLDVAVDGADESGPGLDMLKGGGGALLRERIVASAARFVLIIADSSKPVERLGRFPLPVEVGPFGADLARADLAALGAKPALRTVPGGHEPMITDEGNWIFDCHMAAIPDPTQLAMSLAQVRALAAHGLFLGVADAAFIADGAETFLLGPDASRASVTVEIAAPFG